MSRIRYVLVVDDDRDSAQSLAMIVTLAGYTTATAFDGRSALQLCRDLRPDVVLLDLMLPDVDGIEVCRQIRSEQFGLSPRIVVVSGRSRDEYGPQAIQAG